MFLYPCYISKDSQELRSKLDKIGYNKFEYCRDEFEKGDVLYAIEMDNGEAIYTYVWKQNLLGDEELIDCGDNEDLFLAIASLRDDTDENQWFVSDEGTFRFNEDDVFNIGMANYTNYCFTHWHKATVKELTEYFKRTDYE